MTKEFENFKNILGQKQNELEIQDRNAQKAKDDETARKQAEDRQKQIESDQRAAENKRILENSGIVKLLEEIRDSGIVKLSPEEVFEKRNIYRESFFSNTKKIVRQEEVKIANFCPARIIWSENNEGVGIGFNYRFRRALDSYDTDGCSCKAIAFFLPKNNFNENNCKYVEAQMSEQPPFYERRFDFFREKSLIKWQLIKDQKKITLIKIEEIPNYIAEQISKTLNKEEK